MNNRRLLIYTLIWMFFIISTELGRHYEIINYMIVLQLVVVQWLYAMTRFVPYSTFTIGDIQTGETVDKLTLTKENSYYEYPVLGFAFAIGVLAFLMYMEWTVYVFLIIIFYYLVKLLVRMTRAIVKMLVYTVRQSCSKLYRQYRKIRKRILYPNLK